MMNYKLVVLSLQLLLVATDNAVKPGEGGGGIPDVTVEWQHAHPGVRRRATRMSA